MTKKVIALLVVVVMVCAVFAACATPTGADEPAETADSSSSEPAADAPAGEKKEISIAHIAPNNDVSQTQLERFLNQRVQEYNDDPNSGYSITYDHYNANGDVQTEIGQIESVVTKGYDYLMVFGVDSEGVAPAVEAAHNAGVKIIDICNLGKPEIVDLVFLPYNETVYADERDKFLADYMKANPDKAPLKTCVLYGILSQLPQLPRGDRMVELAEANPDQYEILNTQSADWDTAKAQAVTEDWLQAYPDVEYICVSNDTMAIGVVQALKAANKLDSVLVTSVDIAPEGLQMIKNGELAMSVGVDQFDAAMQMIDNIVSLDKGELEVPEDKVMYVEKIWTVTQDNLDDYLAFCEGNGVEIELK